MVQERVANATLHSRQLATKSIKGENMVSFNLSGRIALVTGASRGIGRAIAEKLAECGAEVILVSRNIESLETVATAIREKKGNAFAFACHMGNIADIEKLYEKVRETYGRLDILVNNAATNPYFGEMAAIDEGAWGKTVDVNLKGPFFMIQKAIPLMQAAGKGAVVNVSSVNGIRPALMQGVYSITKGALITMTQAFAKELAPHNIRVNALLPGFTDTKFSSVLMQNKDIYDMVVDQIPMKRHAAPAEMVGGVLYLVSDAASYTTGTCLTCDGGLLA
jgi:NAD(P)-dependent dehydrogenase (short-subunit alcohol dehydrogenase family)